MSSRRKAKDPTDCEDPACTDMADLLRKGRALASKSKKEKGSSSTENPTSSGDATAKTDESTAVAAAAANVSASGNDGCPLDKGELGAATWGLIHTTAAHYPEKPSEETQSHARAFMSSLATLYPCSYCREDFSEEIRKQPPE
ncbi:unnamed protein product [Hapterophycus canaliculatus]